MTENGQQIELAIVKGQTSGVFKLKDTEIEIAPDTTFDQWIEGLKFLKWTRTKLAIGLASYIDWGNKKFGEAKVDEVLEQLEFEATLVKTSVAINAIPFELRHPNLTGEHYVQLARSDIPKAKKIEWARIASEKLLTPSQLRFSMIEDHVIDAPAARALSTGVITIHGIRQQFDVWLKKVGGLKGIQTMESDHQEEIMGELDAIMELARDLKQHLVPA